MADDEIIEIDDADEEPGTDLVPAVVPETGELAEASGPTIDQEIARVTDELNQLTREAAELATEGAYGPDETASTSTALVPAGGQQPTQVRASMAKMRADVVKKQAAIQEKTKELEGLMREKMMEARQVLAPLEKMVSQLQEGIWTINLYLGREEEILQLADGEPAPAEEPITVRQMVLAMDEECAVAAEEGGIDAISIEMFDEWITADPEHLHQVLPETKGVVALVPRFGGKQYDDPWKTAAVEAANKQTYFLIRNGDRLYRVWTDFIAGKRLVPTSDEFTSFFYEKDAWDRKAPPKPLEPGSKKWLKAEEHADARRRHYMRVALILQGLIDRTTVFQPLPAEGVSFLDPEHYTAGRVRFITDEENALSTGAETFRQWQKRLNSELRVGMRVIGAFNSSAWRGMKWEKSYRHERIPTRGARSYPTTGELYTLEERTDDGGFVIKYQRTDMIWDPKVFIENPNRPGWGHYGEERLPKQKATAYLYPSDSFILPYDLATVEEMEAFLASRANRQDYVDMFPILKTAVAAKKREQAEEQPFRTMLAGVLARENKVEVADAARMVDELVDWWKLANRYHRPLVGTETEQAKAVRAIVAEHKRRLKAERLGSDDSLLASLKTAHTEAVAVARKRDGRYLVLCPMDERNVFVREFEYTAKGKLASEKEWQLVSTARAARWIMLHETERWQAWNRTASMKEQLTGPEKQALAEQALAEAREAGKHVIQIAYDEKERQLILWQVDRDTVEIDEERPLTGDDQGIDAAGKTRTWKRGKGGVSLVPYSPWDTHTYGMSLNDRYEFSSYHKGDEELFRDDALLKRVLAEDERFKKHQRFSRTLSDLWIAAAQSIERAWIAEAEKEHYQRFLEDYHDPELWEGHRKTLKISYPHSATYRHSPLDDLVKQLVERQLLVDGTTVREAATVADQLGIEYKRYGELPDDILDLRFDLPKPKPADAEEGEAEEVEFELRFADGKKHRL